jgi:hypothetical protein
MSQNISKIKIFAEYHGAWRRPNIQYAINGVTLGASRIYTERVTDSHENIILEFDVGLIDQNTLSGIMQDKTDSDLKIIDDEVIDHYVEIKEVEIDGIRLESVLYNVSEFQHSMPDEWVGMMADRGIKIKPIYHNSTEIRLNGTWTCKFEYPVWLWHTKELAK